MMSAITKDCTAHFRIKSTNRFHPHAELSPVTPAPLGPAGVMAKLGGSSQAGGTQVGVTLRLNAVAVCAVFVFLGAIILGAF